MSVEFDLAKFQFKGVAAVVVTVLLAIGALVYNGSRVSSLHAEGRKQVEEYLETELTARKFRKPRIERVKIALAEIENARKFEIVEFDTAWIPGDKTRVRVVVETAAEDLTFHFRFKRVFGSWVLQGETNGGLGF